MPSGKESFGTSGYSNPPFCLTCGTILPLPSEMPYIECVRCGRQEPMSNFLNVEVVENSRPSAFGAADNIMPQAEVKGKAATINELCPECGHREMSFHTMQLRSVDEGQTVFYTCLKCGYNYSVNS